MDMKKITGLKNALPDKRYNSFLTMVADREEVWLLENEDGVAVFDDDGLTCIPVWPAEIFCMDFIEDGEIPKLIEVHDFIEQCQNLDEYIDFMVFPTLKDCYIASKQRICIDLMEKLSEVE